MTKRGLQVAGQGRYLFDNAQGEATAEYLYNDRVTGETRWGVSWKHTQNLSPFLPGLVGYWNLNKVSDDTYFADLADRVGLTSQTTLPREGGFVYSNAPWTLIARAQGFQTLLDPSLPPGPPPYNRVPQFLAALQEVDWKGLTFAGTAEYADFRNPTLVTGQRAYAYPTVAWTKQGPAWYFTAKTGVHARHYSLNDTTPDREEPELRDPDLLARRGPRVRARLERVRPELRADAGAARLLRLRAVQGPEQGADLRHGDRRLQLRAALQHRTAISATTGSATPIRSRWGSRRGCSTRPPARSACASRSASASTSRISA